MCYKNLFRDYKAHPENRPTLRRPGFNDADVLGKLGQTEDWSGDTYRNIATGHQGGVESLRTEDAHSAAVAWKRFSQNLGTMQGDLSAALGKIPDWEGEAGNAARKAIGDLTESLQSLASGSLQMGSVVSHLADTVDQVKTTIPESYESFHTGLDDAGADDGERKAAEEAMDKVARETMQKIYDPGLREAAIGAPSFGPPTINPGPGPGPGPGSTPGNGGNRSGSGTGGNRTGGTKTPSPGKNVPTGNQGKGGDPSGLGNALNSAAQQMAGAGKDAAQKAGDAVNKAVQAAMQKNQATANQQRKGNPGTTGKGTGTKGGGKGGGGKGGGAGGGKGLAGDLGKASLRNALKLMDNAERALLGNVARSAGPMGGMPGGAGAGARGAGEDKAHRAAKYLHTTEHGELLLGTPVEGYRPVVTGVDEMVNADPYQGLPVVPDDEGGGDSKNENGKTDNDANRKK
ncbi:hypothetical protein GOARA_063_00860 [Gordonia araii NBRC 100433]|uniref:Outer membrane channel protein CpnT-like N-terminal domain-containing protein n=1 Tax=Gordonia araii NBRC 100433 TaxID=1073574 RepID=G7H4W2_9ACTN|nr:hypothetical protein [Gordonia araii]NNG97972.1 hypothetical protein [Gordonia araii NBRC 100433]GAB10887.1 hypothetical protein GOARA_063_00860 [Gordonia araii NBRC 100433]